MNWKRHEIITVLECDKRSIDPTGEGVRSTKEGRNVERERSFLRGWGKNRARRGIVLNYCLREMICEATELTKIAPSMQFFRNVMHTFNWWGKLGAEGGEHEKSEGKKFGSEGIGEGLIIRGGCV